MTVLFSRRTLLGAACASALLPGALSASEVEICTFGLNSTFNSLKESANPSRVALVDTAVLDALLSWHLEDRIAASTVPSSVFYLKLPANVKELKGNLKEFKADEIRDIKPDIIFAAPRLSRVYEDLVKIAPTVMSGPNSSDGALAGFEKKLLAWSSVFGKTAEAREQIEGIKTRIKRIADADAGDSAAVLMITSGTVRMLPPRAKCSLITAEMGLKNVVPTPEKTEGAPKRRFRFKLTSEELAKANAKTFEQLSAAAPTHIFILNKDVAVGSVTSTNFTALMTDVAYDKWLKIDAVKNARVHELTHCAWYLGEGGPTGEDIIVSNIEKALTI